MKSQRRKPPKRGLLFSFSSENLTSVNDAGFAAFDDAARVCRPVTPQSSTTQNGVGHLSLVE
jgi:hypothetical protein